MQYDKQALANLRLHNPEPPPCDQRCHDLAVIFLQASGTEDQGSARELGGLIQEVIECYIDSVKDGTRY